jgi:phospholipid/cholesterol/gamma-HCH transport system ATP-binding protein
MLYDEPTSALDPIMSDKIDNLIMELKKKLSVTSIVVTHDMSSAYKIADTIAMIHEGKIIFCGTPAEIRATHNPYIQQFIRGQRKSYYALEDEDSYSSTIDLQKVKQHQDQGSRKWQAPSTPEPAHE